ncbi:coproporphyrinogen dehydrogenase HemZ [Anaerosphaera multitolerans]|nr:coproporphyrinogen dehydrogenase HemZ [Anaerosphaera multitolerans]
MIEVKYYNENIKKEVFEFLRLKFPSYENSNYIKLEITDLEDFNLKIESDFFKGEILVEKTSDIREQKILIKQKLYKALKPHFESYDKWGILTGVRPVKLIIKLLRNYSDLEVMNILKFKYFVAEDLVEYLMDIAKRELKVICPIDPKSYSIYVHIPFCPSKCSYCSFQTQIYNSKVADDYIERLVKDLERESFYFKGEPKSIYIGGGTPTSIGVKSLQKIIKILNSRYGNPSEFTVECGRPDTISRDMLLMLKEEGVNRISINPQSMNDITLNKIGRNHSVKDIYNSFSLARDLGFDFINMDLIVGLPREGITDNKKTLKEILKLNPENITVHTLSIKNGSKLYEEKYRGSNSIENIFDFIDKETYSVGYYPYYLYRQKRMIGNGENVGYSKEGFESIYNIYMMEEKQSIIGFGMSSSSKFFFPKEDRIESIMNFRNIKDYIERNDEIFSKKLNYYRDFKF